MNGEYLTEARLLGLRNMLSENVTNKLVTLDSQDHIIDRRKSVMEVTFQNFVHRGRAK